MRKNLNLLLAFAVCALCASGAQAGTPESAAFIDRGRSLFDFGRWTDARHEFLQARETLSPADREAAQTVDFYLAACAVSWAAVTPRPRSADSKRVTPDRSMPTTCGSRWAPTIAPRAI